MNDPIDRHFILIGKIVGVHGIRGAVKVCSFAESLSVFKPKSRIRIIDRHGVEKLYTVAAVNSYKRTVRMQLEGIDDRNTACELMGSTLYIDRCEFPELDDGEFYWVDIIGLSVYTTDGTHIGRVESILATGSNDVLVIRDDEREMLVPALESVIVDLDIEKKIMVVELPDGL